MEIFISLHILFKVKTSAVCPPTGELFTFQLPCTWPGRVYFLVLFTDDRDAKDTDRLWPNFPAVNERVGTVDHLAGDAQIAADSRSNGSLIT